MAQVRPDPADDRNEIRQDTDDLLQNIPTNDYSLLSGSIASDLLNEAGANFTAEQSEPNPLLTGALSAALPMTIAVPDADNNRLQITLLINPTSLNHNKTSSVSANYTRRGFITQVWGPSQDLLTSNGTTAAFMVDGVGLTAVNRKRSFGYQNFLALFMAYRNNGYQLLDPTQTSLITRVINVIHGVEISYDGQIFMGHFNNFTLDEAADKPFLFDYNFEFVVSSLSSIYDEVRGHFAPMPRDGEAPVKNPRLLADLTTS